MGGQGSATVIEPMSRIDRVAGRGIRERDRKRRDAERSRPSRAEIEAHEGLIRRLTEVHQVTFKGIDWEAIEAEGPVAPTIARDAVSAPARKKLAEYRPSLLDSMLGRERDVRRELMAKVIEAAKADAELWNRATAMAEAHNRMLKLAPDVRSLKVEAIAGVLKAAGAAAALKDVVEAFSLHAVQPGRLVVRLDLLEYEALPDATCAPGATAHAPMPEAERRQLQLANACSAALRAAVEVLQVVPSDAVEVAARLCPPTGSGATDMQWVLHVRVPVTAARRPLHKLEAAPIVADLGGRLAWAAARGLAPIEIDDLGLGALAAPRVAV